MLELPTKTSAFNRGDISGRYRNHNGNPIGFELRHEVAVRDGSGREFARVLEKVKLNRGVAKKMRVDGATEPQTYVWGWSMHSLEGKRCSGWIERAALVHPPEIGADPTLNPKPPREGARLRIDADKATRKLKGLRFKNSKGSLRGGGRHGTDYAGRNPGPENFIYLCFNVPNVVRGGVVKDSIPDGGLFVLGLDHHGNPIREQMTMYRRGDVKRPVTVHFVYGRAENTESFGWIAQANVGRIPPLA